MEGRRLSPLILLRAGSVGKSTVGLGINPPLQAVVAYRLRANVTDDAPYDKALAEDLYSMVHLNALS